MNTHHLPLFYLFNALRRLGWTLGIDEYLVAVKLLTSGIIVGNSEADKELETLCSWLWAKSPEQKLIIHQLCQQLRSNNQIELPDISPEPTPPPVPISDSEITEEQPPLIPRRRNLETKLPDYTIPLSEDPQEYAIAVRSREIEDNDPIALPHSFTFRQEYFPVTQRQMKQSWRSLRRMVREGKAEELDIDATITKFSQEGILSEPVLQPRRINRTDLILFVDQQGSMVPFHFFSRQLVETAQRGGKLRKADIYYFHNCPGAEVFQQPNLFEKKSLTKILASLDNRAVALIISDGGAAREHKDRDRIEQTQQFIQTLKGAVRYCAWLNPMPSNTWENTSAAIFAEMIPMFSLNRSGLNNAIAVLRGRYFKGERPS